MYFLPVRISKVFVAQYRSLSHQEFEVGTFTVFFGKNNVGKTNLLEAVYALLAQRGPGGGEAQVRDWDSTVGAVEVELENGLAFDDAVLASAPEWDPLPEDTIRFTPLPPGRVCYAVTDRDGNELWFTAVREWFDKVEGGVIPKPGTDYEEILEVDEQSRLSTGPFPRPLALGWEFTHVDQWATAAVAKLPTAPIHFGNDGFLEPANEESEDKSWRVRGGVLERLQQLESLATDLLPDFLDGSIHANFKVPTHWEDSPSVLLRYHERPDSPGHALRDFGRGASRWLGIAVQVALRVMEDDSEINNVDISRRSDLSGHVLFVDEPEAHLHPSAVASVVRWCHRMVDCGFNVMAASHHEEFLRTSTEQVTFVSVSREFEHWDDAWGKSYSRSWTKARTLLSGSTSALQELAGEIGMHPAVALSLQRAILFVEGPFDEAVLDEYAGPALDAAGVTIIPIHGTKNLEGLIDGEFTTRLGIKTAILTDNTNTATIWDRSNRKRSSEEIKLVRLLQSFEAKGLLPPTPFGISEDDLLFALPASAIRDFLQGPFPGWRELREECRATEGLGPSDSVNWKAYAAEKYGLPLNTVDGVRRIVRSLDLAGVELEAIQNLVDEVIEWAK
jgi:hypothetical protein